MARRAGLLALFALTLSQYALAHKANVKLPDSAWFQDDPSHPVHELFKRAPSDVGSESWFSSLPAVGKPLDLSKIPKEWTYALANAMKAGKIPDIPVSAMVPPEATEGVPVYPNGITRGNTTVCSSTDLCKNTQMGDVWEAPGGVYAIGFDDGPSPHSPLLLDFAKKEKQQMCHFVIGHYIVEYPKEFKLMVESGGDLAVHTWTHRHMTTLNNLELLAEFGFTMEAIRISSGGKIPKFWRAPYGDSDNRVRAIAMEIFGLRNVMWSHDTNDWKLAVAAASTDKTAIVTAQADIDTLFTTWASGPKNPGLLVLEHETTELSINSFIKAYPALKQNQWNILSAARMENTGGSSGPYREATNILNAGVNTASADTSALAAMNTGVSGGSSLNPTNPQGGNGNAGLRAESPVFAVAGSIFVAILGAAFTL